MKCKECEEKEKRIGELEGLLGRMAAYRDAKDRIETGLWNTVLKGAFEHGGMILDISHRSNVIAFARAGKESEI